MLEAACAKQVGTLSAQGRPGASSACTSGLFAWLLNAPCSSRRAIKVLGGAGWVLIPDLKRRGAWPPKGHSPCQFGSAGGGGPLRQLVGRVF